MMNDGLDEYPGRDSLGRRDFLKILGLGGGILISVPILDDASLEGQERRRGPTYPEDFNAYLLIAPDGKVTGFSGKIEQGQGPLTALPQMIADELAASLARARGRRPLQERVPSIAALDRAAAPPVARCDQGRVRSRRREGT